MAEDDFTWLEIDDAATTAWQDVEDRRTAELLAAWPHRGHLARLVEGLPAGRFKWAPSHCGPRWFEASVGSGGVALSCRSDGEDGQVVLFDPAGEPGRGLRDFWPSPDGTIVAVGVLHGSSEAGDLRLVDAASGATVGEPVLFSTMTRVAWLPDSSAVFFSGVQFEGAAMSGAIQSWVPGDEPVCHPVGCGLDAYPVPSADGRFITVTAGTHRLRPIAWLDREAGEWGRVDVDEAIHLDGVMVGERFIGITTVGADQGRIVMAPLETIGDPSTWTDVLPASGSTLRALAVVGDRLVVSALADGCGELIVVDPADGAPAVVPLPVQGAVATSGLAAPLVGVSTCRVSGGHPEVTFLASGPGSPSRAFGYNLDDGRLVALDDSDGGPLVVSETTAATSPDGTVVPCVLAHLDGLDRGRPQPTLVFAYGGFNLPNGPRYHPAAMAFVLSGGIVAYPMLRGGGEYGDAWWQAGRRRQKQHTFDDLYAVAEHLLQHRVTTRDRLALQGGSNGGITASVAVAQRPDLFGAVVATAPLTDLLRHHRAAKSAVTTAATIAEFGDPDDPDDAAVLRAWSPFHNIGPSATSPAVLVAAAEDDVRTPPWHARKLVARLHAERAEAPTFLRIWRNYGHGTGSGTSADHSVEWLGFVMARLGMTPDGAATPGPRRP